MKNYIKDLRLVEIELFSYCNRKCKWCPNREIDRQSNNIQIEDDILLDLLLDLRDNNYDGAITFSRYNEPMSNIDIFKTRLRFIRSILPYNKLVTNTNGDFITKENLEGLLIDELTIMDYDNKGIEWCKHKLESIGATITEVDKNYVYARFNNMDILYYVDWDKHRNITDRGGFLEDLKGGVRTKPCFEPMYFIGINYDGTVSPCCNIRNDITEHTKYIIGDLHSDNLHNVLSNNKRKAFINSCSHNEFYPNSPCYTCGNSGGRYTSGKVGIRYE